MKPSPQNLAIAFLAATSLALGLQLYRTRLELADARRAPTIQIHRTELRTSAAPELSTPAPPPPPSAPSAPPPPPEPALAAGPEERGPGDRGGPRGARFAAQMAELMKDPDFAAAWRLDQEARVEQRYGDLFQQLNLAPERLAALKTLLVERDNAGREVWVSAASQGMNPRENRDELRQLAADLEAEVEANIEASFGPSVTTALENFNLTAPHRATVTEINQRLASTTQSLSPSQTQALTTLLAETGESTGRSALITDATIARAQGILTPTQIETLRKIQAEQTARQLISQKMRAARERAQAGD